MANLADELSLRARALPPEDRARLAEELLARLAPHDADVEAAWDVELRRRIGAIDRDEARLIPAKEAFAAVRRAMRN